MKTLPLTQGYVALIDDEDYERVARYKWTANVQYFSSGPYVRAYRMTKYNVMIYMHRFILGVIDTTIEVDHINNDPLDNRRSNLRPATREQNAQNMTLRKSESGVRGVYPQHNGTYYVRIQYRYRQHYYGTYKTLEEAEHVAINARRELFTHSKD